MNGVATKFARSDDRPHVQWWTISNEGWLVIRGSSLYWLPWSLPGRSSKVDGTDRVFRTSACTWRGSRGRTQAIAEALDMARWDMEVAPLQRAETNSPDTVRDP